MLDHSHQRSRGTYAQIEKEAWQSLGHVNHLASNYLNEIDFHIQTNYEPLIPLPGHNNLQFTDMGIKI